MNRRKREAGEELWFYVPDYPAVKHYLEEAYARYDVTEHAAEPGRVGGCPNDADVTVRGLRHQLRDFRYWLERVGFEGLMIEGREIKHEHG